MGVVLEIGVESMADTVLVCLQSHQGAGVHILPSIHLQPQSTHHPKGRP